MKTFLAVLAFIFVWFIMWLFFGFIGWLATPGGEFRMILGHHGIIAATIFFGWIPAAFACMAVDEDGPNW